MRRFERGFASGCACQLVHACLGRPASCTATTGQLKTMGLYEAGAKKSDAHYDLDAKGGTAEVIRNTQRQLRQAEEVGVGYRGQDRVC